MKYWHGGAYGTSLLRRTRNYGTEALTGRLPYGTLTGRASYGTEARRASRDSLITGRRHLRDEPLMGLLLRAAEGLTGRASLTGRVLTGLEIRRRRRLRDEPPYIRDGTEGLTGRAFYGTGRTFRQLRRPSL